MYLCIYVSMYVWMDGMYVYIYIHTRLRKIMIKQNRKAGCKSQIQLRSGPVVAGGHMQEHALVYTRNICSASRIAEIHIPIPCIP